MRVPAYHYHCQYFVRDRSKSAGPQRRPHRRCRHASDRTKAPANRRMGAKAPAPTRHGRRAARRLGDHVSRRLSRTARHVSRQSRVEAHRRRAWLEHHAAAMAFLLTGGTLGDIFGRRRLFMIGVALFTAGSLICGTALDNATMIVGRTLTGLGAAFEMPTSLAILSDAYPDAAQRARAIGVWASCNGLAWVVGPTMGGTLLDC